MNLFSNGIRDLGQATIEEWRSTLDRARKRGQFVGVNERSFAHLAGGLDADECPWF